MIVQPRRPFADKAPLLRGHSMINTHRIDGRIANGRIIRGGIAVWLALAAALVVAGGARAAPNDPPGAAPVINACKSGTGCPGSTCPASITSTQATVPDNACPFAGESQDGVDVFSWNEFVAFNWPATQSCAPDTKKSILNIKSGNQGPVVWQTQMASEGLFVAPGQTPASWCSSKLLAALFAGRPVDLLRTAQTAAPPQSLQHLASVISPPTDVEAVGGVVTDQSGRWLRYQRLTNQTEYTAIKNNNWYKLSVLKPLKSLTLPIGSIEFKSAWKILTRSEIASGRYYTTTAIVYNTPDGGKSPGANPVTLGLVGLHIIHKTPTQKGFFWSTFEQVDNDSVFIDPHKGGPFNKQTAAKPYTELKPNGAPNNAPVQIKRNNAVAADPALNAYYQKLLGASVFRFYRLVSTQWQFGGAPQGAPPDVANIAIETYVQDAAMKAGVAATLPASFFPLANPGLPAVGATSPSGCLGCHLNATATTGTVTDHSFLFLEAK
jgi:hypothetical protein